MICDIDVTQLMNAPSVFAYTGRDHKLDGGKRARLEHQQYSLAFSDHCKSILSHVVKCMVMGVMKP